MVRGMARKPPSWWFDGARVPLSARALSSLYAGAISTRRWLYEKRLRRSIGAGVPVIVVGNLIAGGSGKTPLAIALVERLRAEGWTPGVASRGYGRENDKRPLWVEPGTDPRQGGDEPVLIATRTGARVRVDRDRAAAARELARAGCNVIVSHDGLQHSRLRRDLAILRGYAYMNAGNLMQAQREFQMLNNQLSTPDTREALRNLSSAQ